MSGGYLGRILSVDLGNQRIEVEQLPESMYRNFLGGYGLGARYIYDHQKAGVDPFDATSILGFACGPLTGTPAITGNRYAVVGKSPLTHGWGDANSGGTFGPSLKFAGYDGVFFRGIAERPSYLLIDDGLAELRDAPHLWGLDAVETEERLRHDLGEDIHVACIGPAGEKRSLISGVVNDGGRLAARSGLGSVMGSKRLKAIAVRGRNQVPLADSSRVQALRKNLIRRIGGPWADVWRSYGTCAGLAPLVAMGDAPVKNWKGGGLHDFPNGAAISDDNILKYQKKKFACWACPIACGGHVEVEHGPYATSGHKPEYETLAAFGSLCLNDNAESIIKMNDLCNRYGLDTISAGTAIAFAMECYETGLLNQTATGGLELTWGNHGAMVELLHRIGRREGLGEVLADGVRLAAEHIGHGSAALAMHIGGQELPMHDPRLSPVYALGFLLDPTPARHNQGSATWVDMPDPWVAQVGVGLKSSEPFEGRGEAHFRLANLGHTVNASGLCLFGVSSFVDAFIVPDFMSAVTGWDFTVDECFRTGERIGLMRLAFSLREGINPLTWQAPDRMLGRPPLETGPLQGKTINPSVLIADYLAAAGLDAKSCLPTRRRLTQLGLSDIATALRLTDSGDDNAP
jgi:aldehyde:ferredoxin oxidoreductase